jgi:hypothetical protein
VPYNVYMSDSWRDRALAAEAYAAELEAHNLVLLDKLDRLETLLAETTVLADLLDDEGVSYTKNAEGNYVFPAKRH